MRCNSCFDCIDSGYRFQNGVYCLECYQQQLLDSELMENTNEDMQVCECTTCNGGY